jgi:hypothetical protein
MHTKRSMSIIGIILGSSLVALAGEVTDCQTRVQREGPKDLTYWSWRAIDGRQCWYRGDRWKPKEELRWADTVLPAASGTVGESELTGLYAGPGRPQSERAIELTGLDDGPTEPTSIDNAPEESKSIDNPPEAFTSIDNAPEEWRARFADLLLASTCCWPELEPTDLELTGNVELGDARSDAAPAQPLWPMLFLPLTLLAPLALLATWQLVKGGSSRALRASHGGGSYRTERVWLLSLIPPDAPASAKGFILGRPSGSAARFVGQPINAEVLQPQGDEGCARG